MARQPRIHFPGRLYHVITRGNYRQDLFLSETDLKRFLSFLSEYKIRYSFRLYAYALMKIPYYDCLTLKFRGVSPIDRKGVFWGQPSSKIAIMGNWAGGSLPDRSESPGQTVVLLQKPVTSRRDFPLPRYVSLFHRMEPFGNCHKIRFLV